MIEKNISLPELILWTGTRVALGVGIGMLISRRLSKDAMKAAGLALTVVGGFTTVPLAISIMGKKDLTRPEIRSAAVRSSLLNTLDSDRPSHGGPFLSA